MNYLTEYKVGTIVSVLGTGDMGRVVAVRVMSTFPIGVRLNIFDEERDNVAWYKIQELRIIGD